MGSYQQQQNTVVVATEKTTSQAELLQMTLAAHGIAATVTPRAAGYPSVDFVEGIGVLVSPEDEQLARDILSGVGVRAETTESDTDI
jgi:hypothetical protein